MGKRWFEIDSEDARAIQRQIGIIQGLARQRDQIISMVNHNIDFANAIFRAAVAEAKLAGAELDGVPEVMIRESGELLVRLENGKALWTSVGLKEGLEGDWEDGG